MYNSVQWRIIARELARTGGVASQAAKISLSGSSAANGQSPTLRVSHSPRLPRAEALQAVRANNAPVEATSLVKLFGLYAKGLQTLLRK